MPEERARRLAAVHAAIERGHCRQRRRRVHEVNAVFGGVLAQFDRSQLLSWQQQSGEGVSQVERLEFPEITVVGV
jgi:hypothetical protein